MYGTHIKDEQWNFSPFALAHFCAQRFIKWVRQSDLFDSKSVADLKCMQSPQFSLQIERFI